MIPSSIRFLFGFFSFLGAGQGERGGDNFFPTENLGKWGF
jgi:hypothetical protein